MTKITTDIIQRLERIEKANAPKPMTTKEAARYLDLSPSHVYKMTSRKRIPHYKSGKKNYFKKEELDEWMLRNPIAAKEQIERRAADRLNKPFRHLRTAI